MMMRRAVSGMVTGRTMARHRHSVHMRGIPPVPVVPGCGAPVRHQTGSRYGCNGENGGSGSRVAVYRSAIIVAVYREAVHIITGICPGNRAAPTGAVHPHRGTCVHGVIMHHARTQHHGRPGQQTYVFQSFFHCDTGEVHNESATTSCFCLKITNFLPISANTARSRPVAY